MDDAPIGIFDSGVGGLTVARAVLDQLPHEPIWYVGDTARGPYGPRPLAQVREFALEILDTLVADGVTWTYADVRGAVSVLARDLAARLEDQLAQVAIAVENLAALAGLLRGFAPDAAAVLDGATRGLRSTLHPEDGAIVPVDPRLTDQIRAYGEEADSGGLAPENTTPEPPFLAPEIGGAW